MITIEPGAQATNMVTGFASEKGQKLFREKFEKVPPEIQKIYGGEKYLQKRMGIEQRLSLH